MPELQGTLHTASRVARAPGQKGVGVSDEEVQRVLDSIDALGDTGDAQDRARRLTELLERWPDAHKRVREMRQQALAELYDNGEGLTYREIGELLNISFGRVRQILAGETAGPAKRKRAEEKPAD
jgi:DNA-directed RNA polymerase specialized sigma24 family protein